MSESNEMINTGNPLWDYAAHCATYDGFLPGSSAWIKRIRDLLPILEEVK